MDSADSRAKRREHVIRHYQRMSILTYIKSTPTSIPHGIKKRGHLTAFSRFFFLVPKLQLGNAVFEAPASLRTTNSQAGA